MTVKFRPIETEPKDGAPIWCYLYQTGIRLLKWSSAEALAEEYGGTPDEYCAHYSQVDNPDETWAPRWWAPFDEINRPI